MTDLVPSDQIGHRFSLQRLVGQHLAIGGGSPPSKALSRSPGSLAARTALGDQTRRSAT